MSIAHEYVMGPGGRIDVRTVGSRPTVVMIASLGRAATDFDELATMLAPHGFCVAAPEPRGVAGSEGLTTDLGLDGVVLLTCGGLVAHGDRAARALHDVFDRG